MTPTPDQIAQSAAERLRERKKFIGTGYTTPYASVNSDVVLDEAKDLRLVANAYVSAADELAKLKERLDVLERECESLRDRVTGCTGEL